MRRLSLFLSSLLCCLIMSAAPVRVSFSGTVTDIGSGEPLTGVVISVGEDYLWAVTDIDGNFSVSGIDPGNYVVKASYLGYVDWSAELVLKTDVVAYSIQMQENSLALKEVVVTAKRSDAASTSHTLGRDALNHLQMSNMSDMAALLPGGKTVNPDLTTDKSFSLRDGGASAGNAAFGTAVEVDGVRLGNNAGFGDLAGVDTRSISVDNVESVEVITGVPSVEYGDLNSGVVKIHTRRGTTPLNVVFSVNPRTYQTSVSKGFDLGKDNGVVNASAEWTRATKKLDSPYESYTRREVSLVYSNTFASKLRFEAGLTGNLGGMDTKDDPDAFSGEYTKVSDNVLRANTSLNWQVNLPWITSLKLEASANYNDNLAHTHKYNSSASQQPAPHSEQSGYYLASRLPFTYFSDQIVDSKELDFASSLKYSWTKKWDSINNNVKAGVQWKANGNVGRGEYYQEPSLAAAGYRPRPYSDYPFMHNLSVYAEDALNAKIGKTSLLVTAGLRLEQVFVRGTQYENMRTLSPRLNARWTLGDHVTVRGGWGVTEKLPSFHILYPKPEYRDIQTFSFTHGDGAGASYVYYTIPYQIEYNPQLKWQRNRNSELGLDIRAGQWNVSVVGFYNVTSAPFEINNSYHPFQYTILNVPSGYSVPDNPMLKVDDQTGTVYMRGSEEEWWTPMNVKVQDRTFVKTTYQNNGSPIRRAGVELTLECPEIQPLRTSLRIDASYGYSHLESRDESFYYKDGWSHTSLANRSYQYVGIYNNGGSNSGKVTCGKRSHSVDANVTSITHIPEARIIITCRLEMSLLKRSMNIMAGERDRLLPTAYMDLDGQIHDFTADMASDPEFAQLILLPANDYIFDLDGYSPYMSANLSITKEIGDKVSLSFFANNFTNSRPTVYSMATGMGAIFTPAFYYGLTCRLKF